MVAGWECRSAPSTNTLMKGTGYFAKGQYDQRNIAWGVREHAMCACSAGMVLHGGVRTYAATFFIFTDYARPAIRLAALMELPVIFVMTHDSIGLGEDGPTHQPIEHLASLRAMPHLCVIRPGDANEVAYAWRALCSVGMVPPCLSSRGRDCRLSIAHVCQCGRVLGCLCAVKGKGRHADIVLMASGSEVQLILAAQEQLAADGIQRGGEHAELGAVSGATTELS